MDEFVRASFLVYRRYIVNILFYIETRAERFVFDS